MKDPYILILENVDNQDLRKYLVKKIDDGEIQSKNSLNYGAISKWRLGTEKIPEKYKSHILKYHRSELLKKINFSKKIESLVK